MATLIPHRPPILLVERIVEVLDGGLVCEGRIPADGPFADGERASAFLGIELAAQSAAVLEALRHGLGGGPPPIGYLTSIREGRFEVPALPAGRPLLATVQRKGGVAPLALYSAEVKLAEDARLLVTATFSTYVAATRTPSAGGA